MAPNPVFLFAFANDVAASLQLDEEWRQTDKALQADEDAGRLKYHIIPYATRDDIWDKFNRFHNQVTIFHYGGHSGSEGLNLKDAVLEGKNLATLLEQEQNLKLVFLNGCSNAGQVEGLLEKGVPAVIATSAPINDRRAIHLARQFYNALCSGRSVKESFSIAAAYVNNEEKEILLAYRGVGFRKNTPEQFEWGLYTKDEAVLDWKIPQEQPGAGQRGRGLNALAWLKLLLGLGLGALLLFLGYRFLWPSAGASEVALDCSAGRKTAVFVTPFQQVEVDNFSNNVITELRTELDKDLYRVGEADFQSLNTPDYYDTIRVNYFQHSCDTSGLFLGGLWDKQDSLLNCYINLYSLAIKIPGLSGMNTIILNNPPGLTFSVRQDSEFLAGFVIALLKAYEGEAFEALKKFYELEKDSVKMQDPVLKAYVAHYKGNCYAMRGDRERAEKSYRVAATLHSGLREVARENMEVAEQVVEIMRASPKFETQLKNNIIQDSLLETSTPEEPAASSLEEATPSEKESIKAVAERMAPEASEAGQKPEEGPAQEEQAWEEARRQNTASAYESYRKNYPNGAHYKEAGEKIQGLKPPPETAPSPSKYVTDKRNGYKTITLNRKMWMAENLNLQVNDSWCYEDKDENCQEYGRLYTWQAAQEACKKLGPGWRLPADEEWRNMAKLFGGADDDASDGGRAAYAALMEGGSSGFAALPGGYRYSDGEYLNLGRFGYYWSATGYGADYAWYYIFNGDDRQVYRDINSRSLGFSCRCLKGAPSNGID